MNDNMLEVVIVARDTATSKVVEKNAEQKSPILSDTNENGTVHTRALAHKLADKRKRLSTVDSRYRCIDGHSLLHKQTADHISLTCTNHRMMITHEKFPAATRNTIQFNVIRVYNSSTAYR